jgi:hypothetical protein
VVALPVGVADVEQAEFEALHEAAAESLQALRKEPEAARRRAVVVANVPDNWADPHADGHAVLLRNLPLDRIIAVYADGHDRMSAVVRALNDEEPDLADSDLLWHARQELPELIA